MELLACLAWAGACNGDTDPVARGESVYRANCTICHALDPARDGTVGPAVAGASAELLEARIVRAEYPPGYRPKRETRLMPPLPFLAAEVPALAAYLNAPAASGAALGYRVRSAIR